MSVSIARCRSALRLRGSEPNSKPRAPVAAAAPLHRQPACRDAAKRLPAAPRPTVPRQPRADRSPPCRAVRGARVSPAARRLAQMRGVDLATITGSGPAGAIIRADVERSLGAATAASRKEARRSGSISMPCARPSRPPWRDRSGRSRTIISNIRSTSHACEQWLARTNAARPPERRLLMAALAVKSVALAARRFPAFNGFYRDGRYRAGGGRACRRGDRHSRRRPGGAGAARRRSAAARRAHGPHARPRSTHARRPHPQLGDRRFDDHGFKSRRARRRGAVRRHLSAAGGDRRLRQGRGAALGRRRRHRATFGRHHHARRPTIG